MTQPLKVLILEDRPEDAELMVHELERARFKFDWKRVDTGQDFLASLSGDLDVVLSDYRLPGFGGLDALNLLLKRGLDVPFILVSGAIGEEAALNAIKMGAADYLLKDRLARLGQAVTHALEQRRLRLAKQQAEQQTARFHADARRQRQRLDDILSSVPGVVWETWGRPGAADQRAPFVSAYVETMLGYTAGEWLATPDFWLSILHPEDREEIGQRVAEMFESGQGGQLEFRWIARGGRVVWVEAGAVVVRDEQGAPTGMRGVAVDISQRKWAEEDLRETNRKLERTLAELRQTQQQIVQNERLRALGQMASGVAHDFNNALTKILGFIELLSTAPEKLCKPDVVRQHLQMINAAAQDAANVVRRLRAFYRKRRETEVFQPVNLNEVVEQAVSLTEPKWKNQTQALGVSVTVKTELTDVPAVGGDASDLREVLTNLIFNAVDAMSAGGSITVGTRRDNGHVLLEVSDTGAGMTEEVRQRCLEPFFSTKGERGTGLGLSIVYGIVQRHGGTIGIQSQPGAGTTFTVRLPVATGLQQPSAAPPPRHPIRPLTVLVVEDDPMLLEVEAEYMSCDGHTVETATDGCEGLQKFRAAQFDLVLADRAMPQMNGDQLAGAIKQLSPHTPVILITGFGDMLKAAGDKPVGVDLIVPKPFTQATLREAIVKATEQGRS